jgi:hypothetical protein
MRKAESRRLNLVFALLGTALLLAASPSDLAREIREAGLDPDHCFRVRDLQFQREEARFYLNEAVIAFLKPVRGRRLGAVVSTAIEGGEAEMLLIPPTRGERASLAAMTKSPNLEERFSSALMLFTDGTAEELLAEIDMRGRKPSPEEGLLLASRWNPILNNMSGSFEIRLVEDVLAGRGGRDGIFFAALSGMQSGNFDFLYDPRARRQITLGQLTNRTGRPSFDIWTHFEAGSFRRGQRPPVPREFQIAGYSIDATIAPNLLVSAVTRMRLSNPNPLAVLTFEISDRMTVTGIEIDGQPAELFRPSSLRANLFNSDSNALFLAVPAQPIDPGEHEVTIRHEGSVITDAGNKVFAVGSRVNWYPHRGTQFSTYELTFRYPKTLGLVATGDLVSETVEGEEKVSTRRTSTPVRFAGFNLGDYEKVTAERGGIRVDVYANRALEASLAPRVAAPMPPPPAFPRRRPGLESVPVPLPSIQLPPSPADQARRLADTIAEEFEWMATKLGPPPLRSLSVSPIPGNFGQGFPGLLYLSTRSYLDLSNRTGADSYFADLLHAHETAHQWWGNFVTSPGYEDDWLQEAVANYLALLTIESRRGSKLLERILLDLRDRLTVKGESLETVESAGPVVFGLRLQSSHGFGVWRTIVYDKGTWIIHMLRRRMGDEAFWRLLRDITAKPPANGLTAEAFRIAAVAAMKASPAAPGSYASLDPTLETFFDTWVQGTGIPSIKLQWSNRTAGARPAVSITVNQTGVAPEFSDFVPVEIQMARVKPIRRWIRTSADADPVTIPLPAPAVKVILDPGWATLRR